MSKDNETKGGDFICYRHQRNFTTKATGLGVGLAVARCGIEAASGSSWFETLAGEGTGFGLQARAKAQRHDVR